MTLSQPLALWLLALLPLVLLAHSVGVRRQNVAIPTARFFAAVDPSGGEPRPQWRQLQRSWLLWLQLLALAAMAFALAGPTFTSTSDGYAREVLVLDTSASMRASHDGETRLATAKAAIGVAIETLQRFLRGALSGDLAQALDNVEIDAENLEAAQSLLSYQQWRLR